MGSATIQTARKLIKCRTAPVLFFERGHKTNIMKKQTELIKAFVNPTFLEAMKQPVSSIECSWNYSFNMKRKGGTFHVTLYSGEEGQVNISSYKDNFLGNTIIQDYCQTLEDYTKLIEKLDDLIERIPWVCGQK